MICITVGPKHSDSKKSRMDDLHNSNAIIKDIISEINKTNFSGIYLVATNPLDVMTYVTWKYANCNPQKVIGFWNAFRYCTITLYLSETYHRPIIEITGLVSW